MKLASKLEFVESDLLENINIKEIDLIVANLPYLDRDKTSSFSPELEYEPKMALYADNSGTELYLSLFKQLDAAKANPKIIAECGEEQCELLMKHYQNLELVGV